MKQIENFKILIPCGLWRIVACLPNFVEGYERMLGSAFNAQRLVECVPGLILAGFGAVLDSTCRTGYVKRRPMTQNNIGLDFVIHQIYCYNRWVEPNVLREKNIELRALVEPKRVHYLVEQQSVFGKSKFGFPESLMTFSCAVSSGSMQLWQAL